MRSNRILSFGDSSLTVAEWARKLGVNAQVIYNRLSYGWSIERAVTEPKH